MSLILNGGKIPNPGKNAFHIAPKTFPAEGNNPTQKRRARDGNLNRTEFESRRLWGLENGFH
jgi:hypothetical protein